MQNQKETRFFIGSNSGRGFFSYFDFFYEPSEMKKVFLLKGGAGNGKSTLMGKIAEAALQKGYHVEKIYCPSDPSSLDAVRIRETGTAVIDATPPHAREAAMHGVLERYISLSPYVSTDVQAERANVEALTREVKACHEAARKRLTGAYSAATASLSMVLGGVDTAHLAKRGAALARKYLPVRPYAVRRPAKKRFLSGLTPEGVLAFPESLGVFASQNGMPVNQIAVWDRYGLSPFLLAPILEAAEENGYETATCYDPLVPARLTALAIPEAGLLIAVQRDAVFDTSEHIRNIRLDDAIAPDVVKKSRARLKILHRAGTALIEDGCECLAEARRLHDQMEAVYRPYTDYEGLNRLADTLTAECCG